jgi:thiol-disulfide isomerase/thioredoxin
MVRSEFLTYVQARPQLLARLGSLYQQRENMAQYVFMLQVRMAAIQRMEILFYRVAGRLLLEHDNHPEFQAYREGVKRLLDCEATPLRTQPDKAEPALKLEPISFDDSHPPLPSWFGVTFRPVLPKQRGALPTGSVEIESVYLDTPAGAAGIQSGDIVVAVDGKQLHEPFEIRERVMLAKSDQPTLMHILRDGKIHIRKVPLRRLVEPPSMKLPPLIGRDVSSFAPARIVDTDQPVPFSKHKTYLISFWTTWCGPCKATFPDLRRWQEQYGIDKLQVVNISNEPRITVKNWIDKHRAEVPFINAYDPERVTLFRQYQVPGTPTFVLIQNGKIRHIHIGFLRLENLKKAIDKVFAEDK